MHYTGNACRTVIGKAHGQSMGECYGWIAQLAQFCDSGYHVESWPLLLPVTVAKWLALWTLVNKVWGLNPHWGDISQQDASKFVNLLSVR